MINIPSKATLIGRLQSAFQTNFNIVLPVWGQNFLRALSIVLGGEFKLQYLGIASLEKNLWLDKSDEDMLLRQGYTKLKRYPFPATQGVYVCGVTGSVGATIPGQTTFKSDDDSQSPGLLYILDNPYTLTATTDMITLRALTAGVAARLSVGNTLTATQPIIDVAATATVSAVTTVPNDGETLEEYRAKALLAYQSQPSGDNAVSYREEGSLNVDGVQQIYPYAVSGAPNEINLYIEAIAIDSTDGKGTPTSTIITDVTDAVEPERPLGVFLVHYLPVVIKEVDININMTGYAGFTTDQQALIKSALTQFLSTVRPFIAAADIVANKRDIIGNFNIGPVIAAAVPGLPFGAMTFKINSVAMITYEFDNGAIPWLNLVTYI
jgi:uncharacterized phage protein gp47/JayE